jgi:acetyl-CoA carboxylase carboxyl transferase subunit beta
MSAADFIDTLVDEGSFRSWDLPIDLPDDPDYAAALRRAHARSGADEAAVTGRARIGGRDVALVVGEFGFLGGSVGAAAALRVVEAVRRATRERLPLLAAPASGGTRMQEGTPAFVKMIDLARAVAAHKGSGLLYAVYLRHPTTGGALASWGSLGQVTFAEPGALIGFLGPSVFEALKGSPFPEGIQTAENLHRVGVVDGVLSGGELAAVMSDLLRHVGAPGLVADRSGLRDGAGASAEPPVEAWTSIQVTASARRPGARELLSTTARRVVKLSGTGQGERGARILGCVAEVCGVSCVVVAQDRAAQEALGPLGPADLRAARRMVRLADELGLPVLTIIDTSGGDLSVDAEEGAIAGEIARLLQELVSTRVPTVSILLGEGCGGAALALLPADRVVAAQHAWLSPLPPAGASAILHGTGERAAELAAHQRVRAHDLLADGIVDVLVAEDPPADDDPQGFCRRVSGAAADALVRELAGEPQPADPGLSAGPAGSGERADATVS